MEIWYQLNSDSPRGVSDGAVLEHSQGGWLGVEGRAPQGLGLVNEHIWHPSFAWVKRHILTMRTLAIKKLSLGLNTLILELIT